jgi:hypothetical protein
LLAVAILKSWPPGELDGVSCPASSLCGMPSVGSFGRLQRRDRSGILGGDEHLLRERAWP